MTRFTSFAERLQNKELIILDGGMGTEIQRHGVSTKLPLWSAGPLLTHPDLISDIHSSYIKAGADIVTTNTFRTISRTLKHANMTAKDAKELTVKACALAKEARSNSGNDAVIVAGSMAPLEDCYRVDLVPNDDDLAAEHAEWANNLAEGGVDCIFVETMNCIRESVAAMHAATKTGLPVCISFVPDSSGTLLSGESFEDFISAISPFSPFAILLNCKPPEEMNLSLRKLLQATVFPVGVYANGLGRPHDDEGWIFEEGTPESTYTSHASDWRQTGATIIGGCCGTTSAYIEHIKGVLK